MARFALQEAASIDEVKDIRDKAQAMAAYAKQAKDPELIQWATEIKVRAERRAGQMLSEIELSEGGRPTENQSHDATGFTLKQLGINKHQSSRWQKLAGVTDEKFEQAVSAAKEIAGEVTTAAMLRMERASRPVTVKSAPIQSSGPVTIEHADDFGPSAEEIAESVAGEQALFEAYKVALESKDPLIQALKDVERYKASARIAEERFIGIQNEKNVLIKTVKSLQGRVKKLEGVK